MKDMEADDEENDAGQTESQQYPTLSKDPKLMENVRTVFQQFDKDNTGFIETNNLGTLLRWLRYNPTETEMTDYIERFDQQRRNQVQLDQVFTIVDEKIQEPDTIEEFIEAARVFDHDNDGKIEVAELRYAMSRLGDMLDEALVDDLIAELDKEKTGLIDITEWARITFK